MNERRRLAAPLALALAALTAVAACTGSAGAPPAATTTATPTPAGTSVTPSTPPAAETSAGAATASPSTSSSDVPAVELTQAWATAPLTDVSTGETFRIADLAGKVVILETMAIWCSNCRAQQGDVQTALGQLSADDVVFVVLDVDPNEDGASLAEYRVDNGFEGRYAVAGKDVARALAADFGDQFLNPPSTPMLIIGTDGTVTRTEFGSKSPDEIVALAKAHGA
jgi:thiol-disulfide isomerase/thioredoxin